MRQEAEQKSQTYLDGIATALQEDGINTRVIVAGSRPAETIRSVMEEENVDLLMMSTHGRGGLDRLLVGSVAERIIHNTTRPVFLIPIHERRAAI